MSNFPEWNEIVDKEKAKAIEKGYNPDITPELEETFMPYMNAFGTLYSALKNGQDNPVLAEKAHSYITKEGHGDPSQFFLDFKAAVKAATDDCNDEKEIARLHTYLGKIAQDVSEMKDQTS